MKKIYYMGDFVSDNGPANVNKKYVYYLEEECYYCKTNNKFIRVIHFLYYLCFL